MRVSVLFSEPKIPLVRRWQTEEQRKRFSALQRAENSSHPLRRRDQRLNRFQCSSASRKFLTQYSTAAVGTVRGFSALQRAENSSSGVRLPAMAAVRGFQCSSASRKFLNSRRARAGGARSEFQCSSASRKFLIRRRSGGNINSRVSVLFSEPKIPQ